MQAAKVIPVLMDQPPGPLGLSWRDLFPKPQPNHSVTINHAPPPSGGFSPYQAEQIYMDIHAIRMLLQNPNNQYAPAPPQYNYPPPPQYNPVLPSAPPYDPPMPKYPPPNPPYAPSAPPYNAYQQEQYPTNKKAA